MGVTYSQDYLRMSLLNDNFEVVTIDGRPEYRYASARHDSGHYYLPEDVHIRRQAIRATVLLGLLNPIRGRYEVGSARYWPA